MIIMRQVTKTALSIALIVMTMIFAVGCGKTTQAKSETTERRPGIQFRQRDTEETLTLLAGLVKEGKISQAQADSVASYFEKLAEERQNMPATPGENRTGVPGENRREQGQRPNPLGELVGNGTITQEQADLITEVLFRPTGMQQAD